MIFDLQMSEMFNVVFIFHNSSEKLSRKLQYGPVDRNIDKSIVKAVKRCTEDARNEIAVKCERAISMKRCKVADTPPK